MNVPGKESIDVKVPVRLLEVDEGKMVFKSVVMEDL
jgi:hypothetical protein